LEIAQSTDDLHLQKSREYADKALKIAGKLQSKNGTAEALLLQARIEKNERKFNEALEIFKSLKQPMEIAKACYYYGRALGKPDRIREARDIFGRLGARGWIERIDSADA